MNFGATMRSLNGTVGQQAHQISQQDEVVAGEIEVASLEDTIYDRQDQSLGMSASLEICGLPSHKCAR